MLNGGDTIGFLYSRFGHFANYFQSDEYKIRKCKSNVFSFVLEFQSAYFLWYSWIFNAFSRVGRLIVYTFSLHFLTPTLSVFVHCHFISAYTTYIIFFSHFIRKLKVFLELQHSVYLFRSLDCLKKIHDKRVSWSSIPIPIICLVRNVVQIVNCTIHDVVVVENQKNYCFNRHLIRRCTLWRVRIVFRRGRR